MADQQSPSTIDEYVAAFPAETRTALQELRGLIHEVAPEAVETISYAMPTFDMNGRHVVHFAGYAKHVSIYPVPNEGALKDELEPFTSGKATARFPLDRPLPKELIRRIVESRVAENRRKTSG